MNVAEWLAATARLRPHAPALLTGFDLDADYATFARRAAAIGAALARDYGIAAGDRVGLFATNCTQYLECLYGIWWIGAVAIPINAKLHGREAAWICSDAGAKLTFVSDDTIERLDRGQRRSARGDEDAVDGQRSLSRDARRRGRAVAVAARGRRSRLAVLHLGHHRPPQGRDAEPRQSGGDVAVLPRRCRSRRRRTTPRSMPRRSRTAPGSIIFRMCGWAGGTWSRNPEVSIPTKCSISAASSTMS